MSVFLLIQRRYPSVYILSTTCVYRTLGWVDIALFAYVDKDEIKEEKKSASLEYETKKYLFMLV